MMTRIVLPIFFSFLSFAVFSQTEEKSVISDGYIPLTCLSETIYIEKYEPVSSHEIAQAITNRKNTSSKDSIRGKNQILEGANFFNLIVYRRINNSVDMLINETKDTLISTVHARDRKENITGDYRYFILNDFNFTAFDDKTEIREGYYIYDQETDTKYSTYPTIESVVEALRLARKKSAKMDQSELDNFLKSYNVRDYNRARNSNREANPTNIIYGLLLVAIITLATIF